jgi:hypothetical protein
MIKRINPRGALLPVLMPVLMLAALLSLAGCGGGGGGAAATTSGTTQAMTTQPVSPPVVSLSATPTAATVGQVISLTWSVSNPTSTGCTASGAWSGTLATNGTQSVTAASAGTSDYTVTCSGVSTTTSVTVTAPVPAPTVTLALAPASITTAQSSQLTWSATNANSCTASGVWSGTRATSGTLAVASTTAGSYAYTLVCTGAGGSATGTATLTVSSVLSNSTTLVVDNGPSGAGGAINVPYVSVTVCSPGTSTCQTIDHVLVDTGSFGLRLMATSLNATLALPAVKTSAGAEVGECGKFVSGYTWGAVRQADVRIADENAAGMSVQVIGDTGANFATVPSDCSSAGSNIGTLSALGAKGILGIGLFKQDCGSACARSAISGAYYACVSGDCSPTTMPLAQQVSNPVASFATNNNGVLLVLPNVGTAGVTSISGSLIFGVGTQTNNAMSSETVYKANSSGNFNTTYKGRLYGASFIDSGSNGYFFNDSTQRSCSGSSGFYCPTSTQSLSAVNASYDNSSSGTVNFNIVNVNNLGGSVSAAQIGGTLGGSSTASLGSAFDWGLPFFYGRRVFVVIEGGSTAKGSGPYWAY